MHDSVGTPSEWPLEFERLRIQIIELWQSCNISLVHRTYFFLLFRGDPMDSIYMEVELRRLTFLRETFSKGNPVLQNGQKLTLTSRYSLYSFLPAIPSQLIFDGQSTILYDPMLSK